MPTCIFHHSSRPYSSVPKYRGRLPATTTSGATGITPRSITTSGGSSSVAARSIIAPATTASITTILGNRLRAALDRVTHLLAVVALDLGPILGLGAIAREVTSLLAVAAESFVRVLGLVTVPGHVLRGVTVSAGAGDDVGTLLIVSKG